MIEQNKYSDETIHVANHVANHENVADWIVDARREVTKRLAGEVVNGDDFTAEVKRELAYTLQAAVHTLMLATVDGSHDCYDFYDYLDSNYAEIATLFVPAICQYMQQVCWEDVADLVWEHAPVAA